MRSHRVLALLLGIVTGCSGASRTTPDIPFDSDKARSALVAALDAWKKGEAKSLSKRKPAIRFEDDDLLTGLRLAEYEIEEPDRPIQPFQDVEVILELKDARGKSVRREARYQVGLDPSVSVLRSDR